MTQGEEFLTRSSNEHHAVCRPVTPDSEIPEPGVLSGTSSLQAMQTQPGDKSESGPEEDHSDPPESTRGLKDVCGGPAAPDGGWGWVVVGATVLVLALTLAFPTCIGIFYTDLQKEFQSSNTETSWVPALMMGVLHACGPICSALVELYGCRATIIIGGFLSALGMAASSFAQTMLDLYITAGILTGIGFSLSFQPSITMVGHYFNRRRAFANALSSTGTALGLSTLPLLANHLLSTYGWRGSFLVMGGVLLNCCVCGAVMRPLRREAVAGRPETRKLKPDRLSIQKKEGLKGRLRAALGVVVPFVRRHMAFDLLGSNRYFRAYAVGVSWMMLGFVVPLVYLVPYATACGMEADRAALLMAILGWVNIIVRPVTALVFGLPSFRSFQSFAYLFASAVLLNGLSNFICGMSSSFPVLLAYVIIYGFSMSLIGSLLFTVLMNTVEMSRFPAALGLICIMESVTLLLGPPLAGILVDHTNEYVYVFYACCINGSTAGLFIMLAFYWLDRQKLKEAKDAKIPIHYDPVPVEGGKLRDQETDV